MSEEHVLYGVENNCALITLNRPEAKNAFSPEMIRLWRQSLEEAGGDDRVRVVILTGNGDTFCPAATSGTWPRRGNSVPGI